MQYKVLQSLRWGGKNYARGEFLTPRNADQEKRCQMLVRSGFLAPLVSDELLRNLQSVGIVVPPHTRPISTASNNVKQEGEEGNG